jgi:hypothetical protein
MCTELDAHGMSSRIPGASGPTLKTKLPAIAGTVTAETYRSVLLTCFGRQT